METKTKFEARKILVTARKADTPTKRLDIGWFVPTVRKYSNELTLVLVASLFVQLFSLANPLIIQVIIDKVITQRSLDTLQVLGWALIIAALVEALLSSFRSILFNDVTNKTTNLVQRLLTNIQTSTQVLIKDRSVNLAQELQNWKIGVSLQSH